MKAKFVTYAELSDNQVAAALRVFSELQNPREEEKQVPAPTGRQTFRGVVVSRKTHEGAYGSTTKITVKVTTPDGVWLAWGTCPEALEMYALDHGGIRGCEVEITATLEAGREPHFVFMKRPRGKFVAKETCNPDTCKGCLIARLGSREAYEQFDCVRFNREQELRCRREGRFDEAVHAQEHADAIEAAGCHVYEVARRGWPLDVCAMRA